MTDYHFGPLFRFIPNALLYKLGLMKLGDSITDTIEAVMESDLSTSPVTTTDVFAAHNQQNNWWYTGDGDLIVWTNQDNEYNSPMLYYKEHKILDFSFGTILLASAHGDHFYYVAEFIQNPGQPFVQTYLIVSYVDLSDTSTIAEYGAYANAEEICWLLRETGSLSSNDLGEIFIGTLTGPDQRFLSPAFNADCTQLNIGVGSDLHMFSGISGTPDFGRPAVCATVTFDGPVTTLFTPFLWDGGFAVDDNTQNVSITALPVPDTFNPSFLSNYAYTTRLSSHAYVIGDRVHDASVSPKTWEASTNGTSGTGSLNFYDVDNQPIDPIVDGTVTWNFIGNTYDQYDPLDYARPVQHASAEMLAYSDIGSFFTEIAAIIGPARYGTLEEIITAAESLSTGASPPGGTSGNEFTRVITLTEGPSAFGDTFYTKLAPGYPYPTNVAGLYLSSLTPADPGLHRIAIVSREDYEWNYSGGVLTGYTKNTLNGKYVWDGVNPEVFTEGDFSFKQVLLSWRSLFTYVGSRPLSSTVTNGSRGYTGQIPIGWVLDSGVIQPITIQQTQPLTYNGSATGTSGRGGLFGRTISPYARYSESTNPFLTPDALAEFGPDALSADGSYSSSQTIVSPQRFGLFIGGVLQAEMSDLYPPSTFNTGSIIQDADYSYYSETETEEITYAPQTGLTTSVLSQSADSSVEWKRHRKEVLGWNFSGKAFYEEEWEGAAILNEMSEDQAIIHTANYFVDGVTAFSRSFTWGLQCNVNAYFSIRDDSGFAYCYTQPITIGGDILFSTCHSFSDPGGVPSVFGIGSTANPDQFNWLVASTGTVVSSVNLDSGTIAINPALNNDVTRQHIALGYTWGV